jgi:hypothetical protein
MSRNVTTFIAKKCVNFQEVTGKLMLQLRNVGGERKQLTDLRPSSDAMRATADVLAAYKELTDQFDVLVTERHTLFLDLQGKSQAVMRIQSKALKMASTAPDDDEVLELAAELLTIVVAGYSRMEEFDLSPTEIEFSLQKEAFIELVKQKAAQKKAESAPVPPDVK